MSAQIVKPFGDYATPGASEEVVAKLRELLAQAERGEIIGLVYGMVRPNESIGFGYRAGSADRSRLLAAGTLAAQLLTQDLLAQEG